MASRHVVKQRSKRSRRRSGPSYGAIGAVVAVLVFVAGVGVTLIASSSGGSPTIGSPGAAAETATSSALQLTGEVSSMGVPVVETPGYASGTAKVESVSVKGADWALGQVPLNVAVRPFWTLTNTGSSRATLGEPEAQVRQGCCPGPFVLGSHTLAPGESTVLTFELSMHEGMDGWHDMGVYVPVSGAAGDQMLELNVTGDFRN